MALETKISIIVEAVDQATAVINAIRDRVNSLTATTGEIANSAGGISGALDQSQAVLKQFAGTVSALPGNLAPLGGIVAKSSGDFQGLAAGVGAGAASLSNLEKQAVLGAPAVGIVADAISEISKESLASAGVTQQTATNLGQVAGAIKAAGTESAPTASAVAAVNGSLSGLAETTGRVVQSQSLLGQVTAGLAPTFSQHTEAVRAANEQTQRWLNALFRQDASQGNPAFSNLEAALKRVGLGLNDVKAKSGDFGTTMDRIRDAITRNGLALAAFGISLASVPASLAVLTRQAIDFGDALNDMRSATGLSTEFLSSLDLLARQSGTSLGELQVGLKQTAQAMVAAKDPTSDAAKAFQILGVDVIQIPQTAEGLEQAIGKIADGFTGLQDGFGKTAIAVQLFGRSGERLIPLLNQGSAGFQAARDEAARLGLVISGQTASAADKLNDSLAALGSIFRGVGNDIARVVIPPLTEFVSFIVVHQEAVKAGFLGIAAAVTALGVAMATLKAITITDSILTAIAGPLAISQATSVVGLLGALREGFVNLLIQTKLFAVAGDGALSLTALGKFGAVGVIIGSITTAIWAGIEAWKAYKAEKDEALATANLAEQNSQLRARTEQQIHDLEASGQLSAEKAQEFRDRLDKAFTSRVLVQVPITGTQGFNAGVSLGTRTESRPDTVGENQALKDVNQGLRTEIGLRQKVKDEAISTVDTAKTQIALAQSHLNIIRAQSELEIAQIESDAKTPGSTLSIEEQVGLKRAVLQRVFEEEKKFINLNADLQIQEARRLAQDDPRVKSIQDQGRREAVVEQVISNDKKQIVAKEQDDLEQLTDQFKVRDIELETQRSEGTIEAAKRSAQNQLQVAKLKNQELVANEIELQQTITNLQEAQKNLPENLRLSDSQIRAAAIFDLQHKNALVAERDAKSLLDTEQARVDTQLRLAQSDPNPNKSLVQERINVLLSEQNRLSAEAIEINRKAISTGNLSLAEREERLKRITEEEANIVERNRRINIQDPTNLPSFQGSLGFQNQLDQFGNKTGERELVAPFKALDDFLTGTLQATFRGLSDSITGLITGASTWAQVWTAAGNQIIGMVVQLILEYTLFHQIRTVLDSIFHATSRTNIVTTSAVGKAAQTQAAATAVTTSGAVTTAAAPAAAATSIWSFGSAASIGLILALAAIAAIVAALAFASGGVVPEKDKLPKFASGGVLSGAGVFSGPGGPQDDLIRATARPGTGILTADAVRYYGGASFIKNLEAGRLGLPDQTKIPGGSTTAPGGSPVPIQVSNGEAWIAPEIVNKFGGARFIAALNAKLIPPSIFAQFQGLNGLREGQIPKFRDGGTINAFRSFAVSSAPLSLGKEPNAIPAGAAGLEAHVDVLGTLAKSSATAPTTVFVHVEAPGSQFFVSHGAGPITELVQSATETTRSISSFETSQAFRAPRFAAGGVAGIFRGPGGERDDLIPAALRPGTGILTAAAVRHYGGQAFLDRIATVTSSSSSASGLVRARVSPGEAWLAPELVRALGGPSVIAGMNKMSVPKVSLDRAALDVDLGAFNVLRFADGGVIAPEVDTSRAPVVNNAIQAKFESRPNVNVSTPPVVILDRKEQLLELLRSSEGRAAVVETIRMRRSELGLPS